MKKKFLLSHQTLFMRSAYLFPEKRFFIFTAGYGSGKTSSVATSIIYDMFMLKDKKDREGRRPRLGLGGKSLGHLVKTTLGYIISDLENSKTPYKYNSKDNVLSIGNADLYLVSLSRPGDIVGYDVCGFYGDEVDDLGSVSISSAADMTFEAVKAVNERTRQVIPGFRTPFVKFASTSQGQKGLYRVVTQFDKEETGYVRIKARTRDNISLRPEYVDSLYRFYTETEAKVYLEGEFLSVGSGRIFPDFDWAQNFTRIPMDKMVSPDEEIYWAQDFNQGYFRGCAAVLRGNAIYVIKRYEFEQIKDAPRVVRYDFPNNKILWIPDASAKGDILTFASELKKYRIFWAFRGKNPNVEDTVFLCCEGTDLILTKIKGYIKNVKIKDITTEHEVWTRNGWKRVLKKIDKGKARTIKLNGLGLTPEHEVFDGKEWVQAADAKSVFKFNEGEIKLWHFKQTAEKHLQKLLSMMNVDGADIQAAVVQRLTILDIMANFCILMYGKNITVKYRKALLYIMLTTIQLTTRFQIWYVFQEVSTRLFTTKKSMQKKLKQSASAAVKYFFPQDRIIQNTALNTSILMSEKDTKENKMKVQDMPSESLPVLYAKKNLNTLMRESVFSALQDAAQVMRQTNLKPEGMILPAVFAEQNLSLKCRIKNIAQTVVRTLRKDNGKKRVYDLMVEDDHEFVAQGILVHNCNKLLYTRRLVFTEMAKETAEACSLALRDPKTGLIPKGIGKRSPIHDIDSLRMLCYFLIFKPVMKDIRDFTIKRRLDEWKHEEEVFGDASAARTIVKTGGFSIIGPDLV